MSRKVLNVNDDAAARYLMTNILRRGGYEVIEAHTGEEALRLAVDAKPDLVLLDVKLPDVSGLDVCRQLKTNPATRSLLVVQTSALYASGSRKAEGLDSGADAYLAQPIEAVELLATVRAVFRTQHAEEAERRAARSLQRTFDAIQDAVFLVQADGVIELCNDAAVKLLDCPASQLLNRQCVECLGGVVTESALEDLLHSARTGRRELETFFRSRHFRVSADPVMGDDGHVEGTVLLVKDVSEPKLLETELRRRAEQADTEARRKDEFLGMLAHELRNPLNAIGAATSILSRASSDAESGRLHAVIHRQTAALARMVDDLLDISRITRGQIQLRKSDLDVVSVVRQAVQGSQGILAARGQEVRLELPERAIRAFGDDLRLEQVLMNLLGNASKFSGPGALIHVSVKEIEEKGARVAELRVKDDGVGIPAHMLEAVFEPFVQVDQSLARSLGGLGIGLAMVRSLVQLHGGSVHAASRGAGRGTEMVVRLPMARAPQQSSELPLSSTRSRARDAAPLRIVVVEDNEDTLELVKLWLEMMGHEVQGAKDGRSGFELAMRVKPDVAMVDIGLPEISGYDVAQNIRAADGGKEIFLVAVTGYGRPEDRARALDAGFDAHIVKPLDEKALKQVLRPEEVAKRSPRLAAEGPASSVGT